jgi:hypothetical protein
MDDNDDFNPPARYRYLDAAGLKAATARDDAELLNKLTTGVVPAHVTRRVVYHDARRAYAVRVRSEHRRVRCVAPRRTGTSGRVARRATPSSTRSKSPPGGSSDDPDPAGGGPRRLSGSLKRLLVDLTGRSFGSSDPSLLDYISRVVAGADQSDGTVVEFVGLALAVSAGGSA